MAAHRGRHFFAMLTRRSRTEIFGHLYREVKGDSCHYCDGPRQCLDHVPPISKAEQADWSGEFLLVPSCSRCNSILANSLQKNLENRKVELIRRLDKKGIKISTAPAKRKPEPKSRPPVRPSPGRYPGEYLERRERWGRLVEAHRRSQRLCESDKD